MNIFLICVISSLPIIVTFVIIYLAFYFNYKNSVKKFYKQDIIEGLVTDVNLVTEKERVYNNYNGEYHLTIKLDDGNIVKTSIKRSSFNYRKRINNYKPEVNDRVKLYKNGDNYITDYIIKVNEMMYKNFSKPFIIMILSILIIQIGLCVYFAK